MKSFRDLVWSTKQNGPALKAMPKSAAGILPHKEEHELVKLWSEMIKCEEGCQNTLISIRKYADKSVTVQHEEEKLFSKLAELNSQSAEYATAIQSMDSMLPELNKIMNISNEELEVKIGTPVRDYHSLYASVDELRVKRDNQVLEHNRIQDKLEKLRLKGKRSTDVIVEKERCLRSLQDIQSQLLKDVTKLHQLRVHYFVQSLQSYVDIQFMQHGSAAEQFNCNLVGGSSHYPNLSDVKTSTAEHIAKLKALNITDSQ